MQALTADEGFLCARGSGRIEQVFSRAVNIWLPTEQQLLTLLGEGYDNAPNSCRLALTHLNTLFRPGETVEFGDSGIGVGKNIWINTGTCFRWQTPKTTLNTARFGAIPWSRWQNFIHLQLHEDETLFLYRGDNPFYRELARELQERRKRLLNAITQKQNITQAVSQMIGLGIGLTPSADDYLVGLSIILFITGHPAEKYRKAFLTALQRAKNNTTQLSAITLEAALQQRYRESIAILINQIINQVDHFSIQTIAEIKNIGSSSGCDMLYGIADACALSQTYGGNYVSQNSY